MRSFEIPSPLPPGRDYEAEFDRMMKEFGVNAVNHGEYEDAVSEVLQQASTSDGPNRVQALAIQRCRRGGKTFMLHAVAAQLSVDSRRQEGTRVVFISLNGTSPYAPNSENAYEAILSRVAWVLSGTSSNFYQFKSKYDDFGAVSDWLTEVSNRVILIVDELNVIDYTASRYDDMSGMLDHCLQQKGSALLYSTHQRGTADLLRGRRPGDWHSLKVSKREHKWLPIPRLVSENCLRGLWRDPGEQPSFWCAVLRGRVPALVLQNQYHIARYASDVFADKNVDEERLNCLAAVITGEISTLAQGRNQFRAYSFMSVRFTDGDETRYAWPLFMVAQKNVLGKDYRRLRSTLENPDIDEPKAFEAAIQLAILLRLLSKEGHPLVPKNPVLNTSGSPFTGTEMFHTAETVTTLGGIIEEVSARYIFEPEVCQVVAVPMYASFPVYDFFVLHRGGTGWVVAAGYQCEQGTENPSDDAWKEVPLSVWVEGKCRKYRVQLDGKRVSRKEHRGWVLLAESDQCDMLGVSVSEALPGQDPVREESPCCMAEKAWTAQKMAATNEKSSKKPPTS